MRALKANGCEVVAPEAAGCCGALQLHTGIEARDDARAERRGESLRIDPGGTKEITVITEGNSRILVEGRHDAELVERVWGDAAASWIGSIAVDPNHIVWGDTRGQNGTVEEDEFTAVICSLVARSAATFSISGRILSVPVPVCAERNSTGA